jgi:DNA mismatch endonuclease, patch repair protein
MMSGIRGRDTQPELRVRRYLYSRGLRYRLNKKGMPGRPDLVFARARVAVFVHGCFWHHHPGCRLAATPGSNTDFWAAKFAQNVERDHRKEAELRELGWRVEIVWECEGLERLERLAAVLTRPD